jgi:CBS domain-containing protein
MLLTGARPRYLRRDLTAEDGASWVSEAPIWWPPTKVVGRYLVPFLADLARDEAEGENMSPALSAEGGDQLAVDVELEASHVAELARRRLDPWPRKDLGAGQAPTRVSDLMATDPLVIAPEDTVGEVAERMNERGVRVALVAEFGRLIGILTAHDLIRAFASGIHSSEARARRWMTAQPITVSPEDPVERAALLMAEHGIHRLAVVEGERPIGTITDQRDPFS